MLWYARCVDSGDDRAAEGGWVMAAPVAFFGRTTELTWLRELYFQWGERNELAPIGLLHGPEGAGKSLLVEHLNRELFGEKSARPAAIFGLRAPLRFGGTIEFAHGLLRSGWSTVPELQAGRGILQTVLMPMTAEVEAPRDPGASETYTSDGTAREPPPPPIALNPERQAQLSQKFALVLHDWMNDPALPEVGLDALFRVIFIFDAFETYPTAFKSWLGRSLFPAITGMEGLPKKVFLLTGRQPWEVGGQADYWDSYPGAFSQLYVGPMNRHDCEAWLLAANVNVRYLDVVFEETEGLPGRIKKLLEKPEQIKALAESRDPNDPLSAYTAQQRRWLHAGAMTRVITLEALQLLLGRQEGLQAFGWLSRNGDLCNVDGHDDASYRLVLHEAVRDEVIRKVSAKLPGRHREFLEKLHLLTRLVTKVPAMEHRTYLRHLSPAQPFTMDMVKEVFGDRA